MLPAVVLVHSPSVGPRTLAPVAAHLAERGYETVVPSLLGVADQEPPFWRYIVEQVAAATDELDQDRPIVLVAHSNAGLFVPLLVEHAVRTVHSCLFVDAALPATASSTAVAPADLLDVLRAKADGGVLPRWTDWWDEDEIAPLFPDADTRAAVTEEQPRLPLAYYEQMVPVPEGWPRTPCGYLWFGAPYAELADAAHRRGWLVERLPGLHLHQLVDPAGVTQRLIDMMGRLGTPGVDDPLDPDVIRPSHHETGQSR